MTNRILQVDRALRDYPASARIMVALTRRQGVSLGRPMLLYSTTLSDPGLCHKSRSCRLTTASYRLNLRYQIADHGLHAFCKHGVVCLNANVAPIRRSRTRRGLPHACSEKDRTRPPTSNFQLPDHPAPVTPPLLSGANCRKRASLIRMGSESRRRAAWDRSRPGHRTASALIVSRLHRQKGCW